MAAAAVAMDVTEEERIVFERIAFEDAARFTLRMVATDRTPEETVTLTRECGMEAVLLIDLLRARAQGNALSPADGGVLAYVFTPRYDSVLDRIAPRFRINAHTEHWMHIMQMRYGDARAAVHYMRSTLSTTMPDVLELPPRGLDVLWTQKIARLTHWRQHMLWALDLADIRTILDASNDRPAYAGWASARALLERLQTHLQEAVARPSSIVAAMDRFIFDFSHAPYTFSAGRRHVVLHRIIRDLRAVGGAVPVRVADVLERAILQHEEDDSLRRTLSEARSSLWLLRNQSW